MKKLLALVIATALITAPMPALALKRPAPPSDGPNHRMEFSLDGFHAVSEHPSGAGGHADQTRRVTRFESPWGETMTVEARAEANVLEFQIDRRLTVRYLKDDAGNVLALEVEADGEKAQSLVGDRAQQVVHGFASEEAFDTAPYELIAKTLRGLHSQEFYDGLYAAGHGSPLEVCECWSQLTECVVSIIAWVLDLIALAGGCGGGIGPLCFAAILAHELASAAVLHSCAMYVICMN